MDSIDPAKERASPDEYHKKSSDDEQPGEPLSAGAVHQGGRLKWRQFTGLTWKNWVVLYRHWFVSRLPPRPVPFESQQQSDDRS